MKSLLIVRHAKAEEVSAGINDFQRPLSVRGQDDAAKLARSILRSEFHPDYLLSSSALRTRETASILNASVHLRNDQQRYRDDLYLANEDLMLNMLTELDEIINSPMLVGHNPGVSALLNLLCSDCTISLPTSGAVLLGLKIDSWAEIYPDCSVRDVMIVAE